MWKSQVSRYQLDAARLPEIDPKPSQPVREIIFSLESLNLLSPVGEWWVSGVPVRLPRNQGGDGTLPSASGRHKVAEMLLGFMKTDPTAKIWFVK
jgi:hypothetical protein